MKETLSFIKPSCKNKNGWQGMLPAVPILTCGI
jgi:hypothetical protein